MRNAALVAGAVLIALIVLAVAVPALIDWSRYKDQIIARAETVTGRKVSISGAVSLRLLPSPAVSAEGVALGNPPGSDGAMATAARLRLRLDLLPLLVGRVQIGALELDRPVVRLARLADGRPNWRFDRGPKPEAAAEEAIQSQTHRPPKAEPPPLPESENDLPVKRLVIHQGSLSYADGRTLSLESIDAQVSLGGTAGPFLAQGEARLGATPLAFDAAMDRLAPGRASPAKAMLTLPGSDAKLEVSGLVSQLSGGETFRGRIIAGTADLGRTLTRLGLSAPVPAGAALAADSELTLSAEELSAANLVISLGETHATGGVTASLGKDAQVDVKLAVGSLDLDKWQPTAPAKAMPTAKQEPPAAAGTAPPAAPRNPAPAGNFALPHDLFVSTALTVETLSWHGQAVRDARLEAVLDQGEVMVHKASALLPGGSTAALEGTLSAENGHPMFDGQTRLHSDNLRTLLAWADMDAASVPQNRLRAADLSSPVRLAWPELRLSDFRLSLDGAQARGALVARLAGRPAIGLDANVDSLDLDSYRAAPAAEPKPTAEAKAVDAQPAAKGEASPAPAPKKLTWLAGFDADLKLAARRLLVNQISAESIILDAELQAGQVTLRRLAGDLGGAQAKADGRIFGLAEGNPRLEALNVQLSSSQPGRLWRSLGRLGPLNATGSASGDSNQLTVNARAEAGGLELNASGMIIQPLAAARADFTVQGRHANTAQVIRLFSPDYRPKATIGAFALDARVSGDNKAMEVTGLTLAAGPARLSGQGRADLTGPRPQITADLTGNVLALDSFLSAERTGLLLPGGPRLPPVNVPNPTAAIPAAATMGAGPSPFSREPLDLSALQGFDARIGLRAEAVAAKGWRLDQPAAQLAVQNGTASLERLTGKLLGGDMVASAKLTSGALPALSGQMSVMGADLGSARPGAAGLTITQGKFNLDTRFATSGRSSQDMAASLDGDGRVLVTNGVVEGFDLPAVNQRLNNLENIGSLLGVVQAGMSGGKTAFSQLAGTFRAENGLVTSRDLKLDAEGGGATADATIDLPRWTTATRVAFHLANAPQTPLGLRLEGPLDNPRKIIDVNALQQYLVSRGLGRALKGKAPEGLLEGLFGKAAPSAPSGEQQSEQPREKNTGKTILKDLLKGLGGR